MNDFLFAGRFITGAATALVDPPLSRGATGYSVLTVRFSIAKTARDETDSGLTARRAKRFVGEDNGTIGVSRTDEAVIDLADLITTIPSSV